MVEESFIIKMEVYMMVNGKKTKCMEEVSYKLFDLFLQEPFTIQTESPLTMENGLKINFMDKVFFIMNYLLYFKDYLISLTLIMLKSKLILFLYFKLLGKV